MTRSHATISPDLTLTICSRSRYEPSGLSRAPLLTSMLAILFLAALVGCTGPATTEGMTANNPIVAAPPTELRGKIEVGTILGGRSGALVSEVNPDDFRSALIHSLDRAGLLAPDGKQAYILDATVIDVDQPEFGGFDMTSTATVAYSMRNIDTGKAEFEDLVISPYTASAGTTFNGFARRRLSAEGAMRANIEELMKRIEASFAPT